MGYPSYLTALPRFGTLRNLDNPTYGPREGRIARLLGEPYMPHQQYIADVTGEVNPKTGLRIYREILITLGRQQGKTTILRVKKAHRAVEHPNQIIQFAAQDGVEAKKKWLKQANQLTKSPLAEKLVTGSPTTSNGKEVLEWINGSTEVPLSGTTTSGHGDSLDAGFLTEAFAQKDYRVEDNMLPAMTARPDAQFLAESTAGTATSIYWNERVEAERERLRQEPYAPSRIAFFDWSADPDIDDPADPATWKKVAPALGWTVQLETIEHAYNTATTPAKMRLFKRGTLNITDLGETDNTSIFDEDKWAATGDDDSMIFGSRSFSLDITPDRTWAAVAQAGVNRAGNEHYELIKHERGTHWVKNFLVEKLARNGTKTINIIAGTQAALMEDDLRKAGLIVRLLSRAEYASACAEFHDGIENQTSRHLETMQVPLDLAVAAATWTTKSELRVFDRRDHTTDISPLVSCVVAAEGYRLALTEDYDALDSVG